MSRFDSENLNAPHTQRHLDEIPQRGPCVDYDPDFQAQVDCRSCGASWEAHERVSRMTASALSRNALPDWKREELREQLDRRRKAILNYQEIASNAQRNARKHMEKAILIRRELGE